MSLQKPSKALLQKYSQVFPVGNVGVNVCDLLSQRRREHLKALDSFAVFSGLPREPGAEHIWIMNGLRIFQEPSIIHLTGINQANVILILNPQGPEKEILFLAEKDSSKEFWDGIRFGYPKDPSQGNEDLRDIKSLTGIQDIRPLPQFEAYFIRLAKGNPLPYAYTFFHRYVSRMNGHAKILETKSDYNWSFKSQLEKLAAKSYKNLSKKSRKKGFQIRTFAEEHFRLRLPLDAYQVKDVDTAVKFTDLAFRSTLGRLREFSNENELAAFLEFEMKKRSHFGLSFPSIVASGKNATVLHYLKNDEPITRNSLILLDFGVRYGTMHADISRTVPASGKFNPLQALLYNIVLDAQIAAQESAKPGETIRNLNHLTWTFVEKRLQSEFFIRGGRARRAYQGQPHGVSHLMGEQEHDGDPHRLYQDQPLQPGWQISNEPGLYGHFAITLEGKKFSEWIGIRIEDDLLITKTGCRNLSRRIPKRISDVEALIGSSGP